MLPVSAAFSPSRAISHGWAALKREPVGMLLGAFLLSIVEGGGGGGGNNLGNLGNTGGSSGPDWGGTSDWSQSMNGFGDLDDPAFLGVMAVALSCVCGLQLLFWLAASFLKPGYMQLHRELLVDGVSSPGKLFGGGSQFKAMAMWKLLKGLIGLGVAVVALAPGGAMLGIGAAGDNQPLMIAGGGLMVLLAGPVLVYVGLGMMLGEHAVALEELGPVDALERSWELARGNRVSLFLYGLLTGLFHIVGLMLCCVGVLGTKAMIDFGTTEAYLLATRGDWDEWRFIEDVGLG